MNRSTNGNQKSFRDYIKHPFPVIAELISTEENYINVLEKVVYGYMTEYYNEKSEIPIPENLKDNGPVIFSNINAIYEWHKHYFMEALKENQYSVRGLSQVFIKNEHQFHMYSKFSLNKSFSEYLISTNFNYFEEIQTKLNHKESIDNLMITPIQRVMRYQMLLNDYLKHLQKKGILEDIDYLRQACNMIKGVCNKVNEFEELNGIKNFDGLISAQGKLLHRGFLKCKYNEKRSNLYVFLFECLILFTEKQDPKGKYLIPTYNYRFQIPMNKLHFKELSSCKFSLQLMDPNVHNCTVICQAHTKEKQKEWILAIKKQLALQMNLIHNLVHPDADEEREVLL